MKGLDKNLTHNSSQEIPPKFYKIFKGKEKTKGNPKVEKILMEKRKKRKLMKMHQNQFQNKILHNFIDCLMS